MPALLGSPRGCAALLRPMSAISPISRFLTSSQISPVVPNELREAMNPSSISNPPPVAQGLLPVSWVCSAGFMPALLGSPRRCAALLRPMSAISPISRFLTSPQISPVIPNELREAMNPSSIAPSKNAPCHPEESPTKNPDPRVLPPNSNFPFSLFYFPAPGAPSCCVMQCNVPNPSTKSRQCIPTTSRPGKTFDSVSSATRSFASLNVGTITNPFAI